MTNPPIDLPADGPVKLESRFDGALWIASLNTPKANILDAAKVSLLDRILREAGRTRDLKALVLTGEGPHFSFGASVEEHLPGKFEAMLAGFHGLFRTWLENPVPVLAAVRGMCLGGGLELAAFANRLIAAPGAKLGQPEITLAVFAPVASVFLAERVGRGAAEDLCLSGRTLGAEEARALGLVDEIAEDPLAAALAWAETHLLPKSAAALRMACRALRGGGFAERFLAGLQAAEDLYVRELMALEDPVEGLRAFLEKRKPEWRNE